MTPLIDKFVNYCSEAVEADPRYLWWGGTTLISAVLGRGIYTMIRPGNDPRDRLHLNLFTLYIGEPGAGKTTAHKEVREFAVKLGVTMPPDRITSERMISWAAAMKSGIFSVMPRDLSSLINARSTSDFKTFLCNAFDCEKDYGSGTIARKEETVIDACISLISTCPPAYLAECFRTLDWGQGLPSRFLFIWGDPQSGGFLLGRDKEAEAELLSDLSELKRLSERGLRILWSQEAEAARVEWRRDQTNIPPTHQHVIGYWNRRWVSAAKLASLIALSRGSGEISLSDWQLAIHKLLEAEMNFPLILGQSGLNSLFPTRERIIKFIRSCGRTVTEAELRNKIAMDVPPQYVDSFLEDIAQSKLVCLDTRTKTYGGKGELITLQQSPTTQKDAAT